MSDLVERLRALTAKQIEDNLDYIREADKLALEAAAEIERLTAELAAARAKLAQYEQAPVVGWVQAAGLRALAALRDKKAYGSASIFASGFAGAIPLIARPEASK